MSNLAAFRSVADIDYTGKTVFFRADLNLPMKDGRITDLTRLERTSPGIADLVGRGAKVVVASHLGRPKGKPDPAMSLAPVAAALAGLLGCDVDFVPASVGPQADAAVAAMQDGDVLMLENLRFHAGEEAGDADFAAGLARLADVYVNDAFSVSHRSHASMVGLARLLPACAGPLMATELAALTAALENPERPVAAVVGGAKVSTKLAVLNNLVRRVDSLIVGGGMANTFLLARGVAIGASLAEADMQEEARAIMAAADAAGCTLVLPDDVVLAREFAAGAESRTISLSQDEIAADEMILDTGPATVTRAMAAVDTARTLVWNGPMGVFEIPPFDAATVSLARHVAARTAAAGLVSVAGGGDTVAALNTAGVEDGFHYVSTAGGAFLEWMEGRELPGVAILREVG